VDRRPDEQAPPRSRTIGAALLAGVLAIAGLAGLSQGTSSCSSAGAHGKGPRPISAGEADQLAQVRLHNWQDTQAGIAGTVSEKTGKQIRFDGWIDWRRPLLYIRTAPREGTGELLIQAVPGIVAIRAMPGDQGSSKPPTVPPAENWRLRKLGLPLPKEPDPMDALVGLLLALTADHADDPNLLQQTDSQWLRQNNVDGVEVQVILGPAAMPTKKATGRGLREHGGAVAYWVDGGARLVHLETYLSPTVTARVDIDRTQKAAFTQIAALPARV
jgi:hypothetical protein